MFFGKKQKKEKPRKSLLRQWVDAGVFAVIVATVFRMFVFEAYAIPTGSMEGTMLIHDHLYVNKMAYGARVPMTPLSVPLVHNTLPLAGCRSYSEAIKLGYHRLPGFGKVERNDVVVFNAPDGDTAIADQPDFDYYQLCRMYGRGYVMGNYKIVTRPVDKRDNLVKRCIALPGDVVEVRNAQVFVNGQPQRTFPHIKHNYIVRTNGAAPSVDDDMECLQRVDAATYVYNLENDQLATMRKAANVASVELYMADAAGRTPQQAGEWVFPLDTANYKWNRDNLGPITIPAAGTTVQLTPQNIALYRRVIGIYEGNELEEKDGKIYLNGSEASSYTFKMNYYWMMGDNRHNSLDSRYWGFVPEDHIVGKAWFVWYSYGDSPVADIRWRRMLRGIHALEN